MTIEELVRLVTPPVDPVGAVGDWQEVYRALGASLPDDYRAIVETYGCGMFANVTLFSPFAALESANLVVQARKILPTFQSLYANGGPEFPYPIFPESGGLLPWGSADVGYDLCWLTDGPPNEWPVVVWGVDGSERYGPGASELLVDYLADRKPIPLLGDKAGHAWFEPYRERVAVEVQLVQGDASFETIDRTLREHLGSTEDRFSSASELDSQARFKVTDRDWIISHYRGPSTHFVTAFVPQGDAGVAFEVVREAAFAMGCEIVDNPPRT